MRRLTGVFLVLGLAVTATSSAQGRDPNGGSSPAALTPGSRVRVQMNDAPEYLDLPNRVEGRLLRRSDDRLVVETPGRRRVEIPTAAIEKVQVPAGRHSRLRNAGFGLLIGGGVGAALGAVVTLTDDSDSIFAGTAAGAIPLGFAGATIGFLGGAASTPAERWETVSEGRLRIVVQPLLGARTKGVSLQVSF